MKKRPFWSRTLPQPPADDSELPWWVSRALIIQYPTPPGLLSVFQSTLRPGRMPHDIHTHPDAELIVLLEGAMEVISDETTRRMGPGSFFYADPNRMHSMTCLGSQRARFVVLKWKPHAGAPEPAPRPPPEIPWLTFDGTTLPAWQAEHTLESRTLCAEHPLPRDGRLRVRMMRCAPGAAYRASAQEHDELLMLLQGTLHGLGHTAPAPGLIYYPAGTPRHLAAQSSAFAALAFEFHGTLPQVQAATC